MSDKPLAILVTALAIAPVCAVCILGPVAVGGALAGWFGWVSGIGPVPATALAIIGAIVAYGLLRRRQSRARNVIERDTHA